MSDLVGNPEGGFSHNFAHMFNVILWGNKKFNESNFFQLIRSHSSMTNLRKMIHVHSNLNLDLVNIKLHVLKLAVEIQEFYGTDYGTEDLP